MFFNRERIVFLLIFALVVFFSFPSKIEANNADLAEVIEGWTNIWGRAKEKIHIAQEDKIVKSGKYSLKVVREEGGVSGFEGVVAKTLPMGEGKDGISFWIYGDMSGAPLKVYLSEEDWNSWTYTLTLDFEGWRKFVIPKSVFTFSRSTGKETEEWEKINYLNFYTEFAWLTTFYLDEIEFVKVDKPLLPEDYYRAEMKGEPSLSITISPFEETVVSGAPVILEILIKDLQNNPIDKARLRAKREGEYFLGWREIGDGRYGIFIPTQNFSGKMEITIEARKIDTEKKLTLRGRKGLAINVKARENPFSSFFPIGLWFGFHSTEDELYEKVFKDISEHDINFLIASCYPPYEKLLQYADKNGIKVIARLPEFEHFWENYDKMSWTQLNTQVRSVVKKYSKYESLVGYYVRDEINLLGGEPENIIKESLVLKGLLESLHPSSHGFFCFAGAELGAPPYKMHFESVRPWMLCIDDYPFSAKKETTVATFQGLASNVERAYQTANGVPVWMILLGASSYYEGGTPGLRMPTPAEMKAQVYTAIAHGAKGIFYFTYAFPYIADYKSQIHEGYDTLVSTKKTDSSYEIVSTPAWDTLKKVHMQIKSNSDLFLDWERDIPFGETKNRFFDVQFFKDKKFRYAFVINRNTNSSQKLDLVANMGKVLWRKEVLNGTLINRRSDRIEWNLEPGEAVLFQVKAGRYENIKNLFRIFYRSFVDSSPQPADAERSSASGDI